MPKRQRSKKPRRPQPSGQWSGPIPGQTVMHPRRLGALSYGTDANDEAMGATIPENRHMEVDPHGFVAQVHDRTQMGRQFRHLDPDIESISLYSTHGGSVKLPSVRAHWESQPLTRIRTDTPLHTDQSAFDTEYNGNLDALTEELKNGGRIKEPAWVVRDKGKLFVLDGHHRITAARRAGLSHFPVRLWDRDATPDKKP